MMGRSEVEKTQEIWKKPTLEAEPNSDLISEQLTTQTEEKIEEVSAEIEESINQLDDLYNEAKAEAGVEDVEELRELEGKVIPLKLKLSSMRTAFKKVLPFLLPLMVAGKLYSKEVPSEVISFNNHAVAAEQLRTKGITDERSGAYTPGISELLYRGITPVGYRSVWSIVKQFPESLITNRKEMSISQLDPNTKKEVEPVLVRKSENLDREDAWRLYLGLPQEHNTFGISDFKPAHSKEDKFYYKINNWLEHFSTAYKFKEPIKEIVQTIENKNKILEMKNQYSELEKDLTELRKAHQSRNNLDSISILLDQAEQKGEPREKAFQRIRTERSKIYEQIEKLEEHQNNIKTEIKKIDSSLFASMSEKVGDSSIATVDGNGPNGFGVMGNFKLSTGQDQKGHFISYYDKWDLGGSVEGEKGILGKPYEIYDRIYYNPSTFEAIP